MSLLCPKCHNVMHQYERNGVVVDQCTECKGLFLDRGELEKLSKAESRFYGDDDDRPAADPRERYQARHEPRPEPRYEAMTERRYEPRPEPRYEPRHEERRSYDDDHRYSKKHKRRSFLEELFD
jgi:uncharacterized protein